MDRFTARLVEDAGCLVWTGATDKDGYPIFQLGTKHAVRGHRWWWEQHHGSIPPGLQVCHGCDRPPCVRHLFLGTSAENIHDRDRKGRTSKGEAHCRVKLTDQQVADIRRRRSAGERPIDLAREYGVSKGHVSNLTRPGSIWRR